ncbi:hypothetical protein COW36_05840 [bacterium (Candidatus Blackallbacteria) CG17_big_fil_post_rev_8_21_14_2_50_48_46]|uniref:Uncharacterized protein n=1 Tax=bacterium (Candidatus Blackallbacteria) CG17_big_fil_post_rev_8_21_14_2_50_48_46 TaxID=2014261 RepID=A0A2M7G8E1_9BACT|nr:MAG: hypothetical protein COW64_21435 [bacterium (Candidatus Blackallbacteria) CG18_big_fil_WC_8_21_14_2_50_49_26]PIW18288.1 MAG: hypothetical protein COW36_05840 [bacterium (Candidatus Blackallbacteria) CG17_big_fil_post_rev_8_21_14_2_50_48_46]PIW49512.1 MAG: hypothetical protein COW20_05655 [bacterium (Candidatus Blackallbacteria) CG13_big_fil_rev_8_21_14_2_50_49_14]
MKHAIFALVLAGSVLLSPPSVWANPAQDLVLEALRGNSAGVEKALLVGADPNQLIPYGTTQIRILSWASRWGNLHLMQLLIDKGADPNARDLAGYTPIKWAVAFSDQIEVLEFLVKNGADINLADAEGYTPLMSAAMGGNLEIVKFLIEKGAKLQAQTDEGYNALLSAARYGHMEVLEYFIHQGSDLAYQDRLGRSVLTEAIWGNHLEVVSYYLRFAKDPQARSKALKYAQTYQNTEILQFLNSQSEAASPQSANENLLQAVKTGNIPALQAALAQGASPHAQDATGKSALNMSIQSGKIESVQVLLEAGAELNPRDSRAVSPLMLATAMGQTEIVKILLAKGADPQAVNPAGASLIETAALLGHGEIFKLFLQSEPQPNSIKEKVLFLACGCQDGNPEIEEPDVLRNRLGLTTWLLETSAFESANLQAALVCAASHGYLPLTQLLLDKGAVAKGRTPQGEPLLLTLLGNAYLENSLELIQVFLERGADPNAQSAQGETALMRAAEWETPAVLKYLLEKGAQPDLKDTQGKTALDYAKKANKLENIRFLAHLCK